MMAMRRYFPLSHGERVRVRGLCFTFDPAAPHPALHADLSP